MSRDRQDDHDDHDVHDFVVAGDMGSDAKACARRGPDGEVELGALVRMQEGAPITHDVYEFDEMDGDHWRGRRVYSPPHRQHERSGPAKVNSRAYRDGWDKVFN